MTTYQVSFYKKADPDSRESDQYLGSVEVDDTGVDRDMTLTAKAFRQAPSKFFYADKIKVQRV